MSGVPSLDNWMLWAALVTTFFTFCRSGEITVENEKHYDPSVHFSYADLAVDNSLSPKSFLLIIKCSKTDKYRKSVKVILGRANDDLCPITVLLSYR